MSFISFLTGVQVLCAQDKARVIKGRFTDRDRISVAYLNVVISVGDSTVEAHATDKQGRFRFRLPIGSYRLSGLYFGKVVFERMLELARDIDLGEIRVDLNLRLGAVDIRINQPVFERHYDKLICHIQNSPLRSGYNGLEVLRRLPKIRVDAQGNIALKNGMPAIQINGRALNLSESERMAYLSHLNAEDIKSVEIQETGSAESDAEDRGGVINIVLKKTPIGLSALFKASYEYRKKSYGRYLGATSLRYGTDQWSLYGNLNDSRDKNRSEFQSVTDIYDSDILQKSTGFNRIDDKALSLRGGLVFSPNSRCEIGTEFYFDDSDKADQGLSELNMYNPNWETAVQNSTTTDDTVKTRYLTVSYSFKRDTSATGLRFIGDIGSYSFDRDNGLNAAYTLGGRGDSDIRYRTGARTNYHTAQLDFNHELDSHLKFSLGFKNSHVKRDNRLTEERLKGASPGRIPEDRADFTNREDVLAGYAALLDSWGKNEIKVGLRTENSRVKGLNRINVESVHQNYTTLFPSFYYGYQLSADKNLSFSYSKHIGRPSFRDLNPFIVKTSDFSFIEGNPQLKPQYEDQIDVRYQTKKHALSLFGKFTQDFITYQASLSGGDVKTWQPLNFGSERILGTDYSYSGNPSDWLFINFSLQLKYYEFELKDRAFQSHRISFYNGLYASLKLSESLSLDISSHCYSPYQFSTTENKGYYKLDLSIRKAFLKKRGRVEFYVSDLLKTFKIENTSYFKGFSSWLSLSNKKWERSFRMRLQFKLDNRQKVKQKSIQSEDQVRRRL